MYEYYNSSSIEDDLTFETSTTLQWRVDTGPGGVPDRFTVAYDDVQVAEVQAITTG